jgi:hypothetical protein
MVRPPRKNRQKPLTHSSFSISAPGAEGFWKTQGMEKSRNLSALKERVLRPKPCLYLRIRKLKVKPRGI